MKQRYIALKHGDPVPAGRPMRSVTKAGYVRLKWKVAPYTYICVMEHRLVCGVPPSHLDVHHINGVKHDNRRENLVVLTAQAHASKHAKRMFDIELAARLYMAGATYKKLAARFSVHYSSIIYAFRRHGIASRPKGHSAARSERLERLRHFLVSVHRPVTRNEVAAVMGCSEATVGNDYKTLRGWPSRFDVDTERAQ